MIVYVLTEGWYEDMKIYGVVDSWAEVIAWVDGFKPSFKGEFNTRDWYRFEIGEIEYEEDERRGDWG